MEECGGPTASCSAICGRGRAASPHAPNGRVSSLAALSKCSHAMWMMCLTSRHTEQNRLLFELGAARESDAGVPHLANPEPQLQGQTRIAERVSGVGFHVGRCVNTDVGDRFGSLLDRHRPD